MFPNWRKEGSKPFATFIFRESERVEIDFMKPTTFNHKSLSRLSITKVLPKYKVHYISSTDKLIMKTYTRLRTQREVEEGHGHRHGGVGARYNVDLVAIPVSFNRIKQLVYVSGFVLTLLIIIKATCNYLKMILNNPRESQ